MTDTWEDIVGSSEKPSLPLSKLMFSKNPEFEHESEEITSLRRARALEVVFKTFEDPQYNESGMLTAERGGKKFDFWPASDCYFIYSTQKYGKGIESLCALIEKHLGLKKG